MIYIKKLLKFSFAVGGDGKIYEGRGWKVVGAHAPGYNFNSVGICLIGDWRSAYQMYFYTHVLLKIYV